MNVSGKNKFLKDRHPKDDMKCNNFLHDINSNRAWN